MAFWVGQQTQLNQFARADRNLAWIHIAFLCAVTLTPFSTSLLAEFIHYRTALLVCWFNIFFLGLTLYWSWSYATRAHLLSDDAPADIHPAVGRRILIAQSLYAAGAALCFFNTYYSIAAIVLVQVNYAIAPNSVGGCSRADCLTIRRPVESGGYAFSRVVVDEREHGL